MPDIKLYDYQRGHHPRAKFAMHYPMPDKKTATIRCKAPWADNHMVCCYYDENDNLIGVRFIYRDGKYVDLIEVKDIS